MKKHRLSRATVSRVDMTPMLDITMILNVFFIVSLSFFQEEGIDLQPRQSMGVCDCIAPTLIRVTDADEIYVNGVEVPEAEFSSWLRFIGAEHGWSTVALVTEDGASHGLVVRLWDQLHTFGLPIELSRA